MYRLMKSWIKLFGCSPVSASELMTTSLICSAIQREWSEPAVQPDYQATSCLCLKLKKKKLSGRTTRCHYNSNLWASVTKLQSQRRHPIPRKWKCHSHPMSGSELCLFLVPVGLLVWLLRVCLRRLINTNPVRFGSEQESSLCWFQTLSQTTGSYKNHIVQSLQRFTDSLCKYVEIQ